MYSILRRVFISHGATKEISNKNSSFKLLLGEIFNIRQQILHKLDQRSLKGRDKFFKFGDKCGEVVGERSSPKTSSLT